MSSVSSPITVRQPWASTSAHSLPKSFLLAGWGSSARQCSLARSVRILTTALTRCNFLASDWPGGCSDTRPSQSPLQCTTLPNSSRMRSHSDRFSWSCGHQPEKNPRVIGLFCFWHKRQCSPSKRLNIPTSCALAGGSQGYCVSICLQSRTTEEPTARCALPAVRNEQPRTYVLTMGAMSSQPASTRAPPRRLPPGLWWLGSIIAVQNLYPKVCLPVYVYISLYTTYD